MDLIKLFEKVYRESVSIFDSHREPSENTINNREHWGWENLGDEWFLEKCVCFNAQRIGNIEDCLLLCY